MPSLTLTAEMLSLQDFPISMVCFYVSVGLMGSYRGQVRYKFSIIIYHIQEGF